MAISEATKQVLVDLAWKTANTFWQAFSAVFVFTDFSSLRSVTLAAAAAGLAAVKTFISGYVKAQL